MDEEHGQTAAALLEESSEEELRAMLAAAVRQARSTGEGSERPHDGAMDASGFEWLVRLLILTLLKKSFPVLARSPVLEDTATQLVPLLLADPDARRRVERLAQSFTEGWSGGAP